jgi:hypothetical protein
MDFNYYVVINPRGIVSKKASMNIPWGANIVFERSDLAPVDRYYVQHKLFVKAIWSIP